MLDHHCELSSPVCIPHAKVSRQGKSVFLAFAEFDHAANLQQMQQCCCRFLVTAAVASVSEDPEARSIQPLGPNFSTSAGGDVLVIM